MPLRLQCRHQVVAGDVPQVRQVALIGVLAEVQLFDVPLPPARPVVLVTPQPHFIPRPGRLRHIVNGAQVGGFPRPLELGPPPPVPDLADAPVAGGVGPA